MSEETFAKVHASIGEISPARRAAVIKRFEGFPPLPMPRVKPAQRY